MSWSKIDNANNDSVSTGGGLRLVEGDPNIHGE